MQQKNKKVSRKKKPVIDIDDLLKESTLKDKYKQSLSEARGSSTDSDVINKLNLRTGYYSLRTKIIKHPWLEQRPASKALNWLFKTVFKDSKTFQYHKRLLLMGQMYSFEYKNPKYKGTKHLPWFDKYPLVLSLGPVVTKLGIRNLGFNLHLLPPKVRITTICGVFELYKRLYRYSLFFKIQNKPVQIHYKHIIKHLEKYGVKFAIRLYIPNRMNKIVYFPVKFWHNAIFIPSLGYDSIRAAQLIKEWKLFCRKSKYSGNENINWKSVI